MLERLGLSQSQSAVYEALLDVPDASAGDIHAALPELTSPKARAAITDLVDLGFAVPTADRGRFSAVPPNVAVPSAIQRRADEAVIANNLVPTLVQRFWNGRQSNPGVDFIEVVTTREQIAARWGQLETLTRHTLRAFDRPPYVSNPTASNQYQLAGLARGVTYRVVYSQAAVDIPERWPALTEGFEAGEQAGVVNDLPSKLTLFDDFAGIVSLHGGDAELPAMVMIIHESPLLTCMHQLFESTWDRAIPLSEPGTTNRRSGDDPELSRMLAAGLSDDTIHRALGVSPSTVHRRIKNLFQSLGAQTRFQAGYLLATRRRQPSD